MLRITARLLENLIMEVIDHDSDNDFMKSNGEPKGFLLGKLVKCIKDLSIPFSIWEKVMLMEEAMEHTYDWSRLDKKKLLYKLPG